MSNNECIMVSFILQMKDFTIKLGGWLYEIYK